MRRKRIVIAVSGILLAVVLLWAIGRMNARRSIRFADGRRLTIQQVTYGTDHEFLYGKPWYRMMAAVVPAKWRQKLPVRVLRAKSSEPTLMIWGEWELSGTNRPAQAVAISETNQNFRVYGTTSTISSNIVVMGWSLDNFPRRARKLTFQLEEFEPPSWKSRGTF